MTDTPHQDGLPALPEPIIKLGEGISTWDKFNKAQMSAHGAACFEAGKRAAQPLPVQGEAVNLLDTVIARREAEVKMVGEHDHYRETDAMVGRLKVILAAHPKAQPITAVQELIAAAERVSWKFGHNESGEPSDWTEWSDLREAIAATLEAAPTQRKPLTDDDMRDRFEKSVLSSSIASSTPLGNVTINGSFHHYANADTDTMWIGYRAGVKAAERAHSIATMQEKP